ncbi:hypothetical protein C9J03_04060 [Photobacterium gaetbulicola]|uniref:hypothetical protein n=1 Tax=Photobacterium gaetbulicola TaxID=1295392 RepID=UPI0005CC887B|nr:hypothetical protein [Photobacterium gaetbulicola]PSU14088.1 hypothetical protein C9J03_04060 [Photobacterium gaetbulicola]
MKFNYLIIGFCMSVLVLFSVHHFKTLPDALNRTAIDIPVEKEPPKLLSHYKDRIKAIDQSLNRDIGESVPETGDGRINHSQYAPPETVVLLLDEIDKIRRAIE